MSAETVLGSYEEQAEKNYTPTDKQVTSGGFIYSGKGKNSSKKNKGGVGSKIKKFGAVGFITVMIIVFAVVFGAGNLIPSAISNRLLEETDVQYADAVQSKEIVFQEALREGDIPDNTTELLKSEGVLVGHTENDGFVEGNQYDGELVLKMGEEIITANQFIDKVNSNPALYNAFNKATYSRAAYWYDDSAKEVMKKYGTNRNNYTSGEDFDKVMEEKMKSGNSISVNNMETIQEEVTNSDGSKSVETRTVAMDSLKASEDASDFVSRVGGQNKAINVNDATLNAADEIKVADTISSEQRSGLFYLLFMENISKMQAGNGNTSQINEAMNYLYTESEEEVVDVKTGELIRVKGTALESPSLYAILAGEAVDVNAVDNYSNDRVLRTVENKVGVKNGSISDTITSADSGLKGAIGRLFGLHTERANQEALSTVTPTVSKSLINNSYKTIKGVPAGEMLVKGAVNVGKDLAKYSGATAGSEESVVKYSKLNADILAIEAAADRLNRSPFDISSKNTFLGSIVYNFAMGLQLNKKSSSLLTGMASIVSTTSGSISSLMGVTYADGTNGYLTSFGNCETIGTINAVGSPQCSMTATFDVSTLDDPLHNPEYLTFTRDNTDGSELGKTTVKTDSKLANFIKNNIRRTTPVGITDAGILSGGVSNASSNDSVGFVSNIYDVITGWFNNSFNTEVKRAATGELFVNSSSNEDWNTYKWAQRYVSLARAQESLRNYAVNYDGRVAYNINTLEGTNNPIIAYIYDYCDDSVVANN